MGVKSCVSVIFSSPPSACLHGNEILRYRNDEKWTSSGYLKKVAQVEAPRHLKGIVAKAAKKWVAPAYCEGTEHSLAKNTKEALIAATRRNFLLAMATPFVLNCAPTLPAFAETAGADILSTSSLGVQLIDEKVVELVTEVPGSNEPYLTKVEEGSADTDLENMQESRQNNSENSDGSKAPPQTADENPIASEKTNSGEPKHSPEEPAEKNGKYRKPSDEQSQRDTEEFQDLSPNTSNTLEEDSDGAAYNEEADESEEAPETEPEEPPSVSKNSGGNSDFPFDGVRGTANDYAVAKVVALAQSGEGAILYLSVDGYDAPLRMVAGAAEAMAVLTAVQERKSKRPVTHEAWSLTLAAVGWKVARVVISGLENDVYQSRVILRSNDVSSRGGKSNGTGGINESAANQDVITASHRSVELRPSDGIALALRSKAPLYVAKSVAGAIVSSGKPKKPGDLGLDPLRGRDMKVFVQNDNRLSSQNNSLLIL